MKIYTKTGDNGQTGLIGGERVAKSGRRMSAIGDVDELNAALGLCAIGATAPIKEQLEKLQCWLFDLGAELATPEDRELLDTSVTNEHISQLEFQMDEMTAKLPPLTHFILPGGSELAARLHWARTVCQRAERAVFTLSEQVPLRAEPTIFLNRVADWLFLAARTANHLQNVQDVLWSRVKD